jgi:pimeloyl-ACP methyl ester carboxylesterase
MTEHRSSFQQQYFDSDSLRLNFAVGSPCGAPLVLLHGVARKWTDFAPLLPELAARYHVHALEFRGHGNSDRANKYLVVDYAHDAVRWIEYLAEQLGQPVIIYGHSLGAMVAAMVAAELPGVVRTIVLEDPPQHTMGTRIRQTPYYAQFIGMRELARRGGSTRELAHGLAEVRVATATAEKRLGDLRDDNSLRQSAECLSVMDAEVLTPVIEERWLDGYDEEAIWRAIQCPTLLLQADSLAGGALSDEDTRRMEVTIKSCRRVSFSGVGHLIHWQQPERVLSLVNEFVESTQ